MFVYTSKNGFTWANELGFCYVLDEFVSPFSAILTCGKDMKDLEKQVSGLDFFQKWRCQMKTPIIISLHAASAAFESYF